MNKDNLIKDVLSLIHNQNIENEIREALSSKQEKQIEKTSKRKEKTSNGYDIYYNKISGEAVGIVYQNIVFLKHISENPMSWYDAVSSCKEIVINGVKAQLCPVNTNWRTELKIISEELCLALEEIGAEHLDCWIWASKFDSDYAWIQYLRDGKTDYNFKLSNYYVRPVLVLE